MNSWSTWTISFFSILGVLFRPFKIPEWAWAIAGAIALLAFQIISFHSAAHAVGEGVDVYLFLLGMMLLSELAREEGVFDWLAGWATLHAKGSSRRLFCLIYFTGVVVTVFLSNDATAVVMTPAVYAAVKKAGAKPLPYLFACAFIANAASFVLPISNPANLVVFASHPPRLFEWLGMFALPSVASISVTFFVLWIWFRKPLRKQLLSTSAEKPKLKPSGKISAFGILGVVAVLLTASFLDWNLGLPTFVSSFFILLMVFLKKKKWPGQILKEISWGVIPLVAGLFVIVEAMNEAGALVFTQNLLLQAQQLSAMGAKLTSAFGVGIASNFINNLPVGLVSGLAVRHPGISEVIRNSVLLGVDLGPNLSVTGSLATILWLMALRREGEKTSGFLFFKIGLIAMPLALACAILAL